EHPLSRGVDLHTRLRVLSLGRVRVLSCIGRIHERSSVGNAAVASPRDGTRVDGRFDSMGSDGRRRASTTEAPYEDCYPNHAKSTHPKLEVIHAWAGSTAHARRAQRDLSRAGGLGDGRARPWDGRALFGRAWEGARPVLPSAIVLFLPQN